ncbi:hypothetical protein GQ457_11G026140 [Hibiscus cannabinus]
MQEKRPIEYFSEKLNGAVLNYPVYDKEMYALIWAIETWQHYLLCKEFVIHTDHEALRYITEFYGNDPDFCEKFNACEKCAVGKFYRHDGYLFKENRICIPQGSMRDILLREAHEGGLMGHFGVTKTLQTLNEHLFWPKMHRDVERFCECCVTCRKAKSKVSPEGMYLPLPIPDFPLTDIDTCMRRVKLHILDKKLKLFDAINKAQINACIGGLKRCILDKKLKLFVKSEKSANLRRRFGWDSGWVSASRAEVELNGASMNLNELPEGVSASLS